METLQALGSTDALIFYFAEEPKVGGAEAEACAAILNERELMALPGAVPVPALFWCCSTDVYLAVTAMVAGLPKSVLEKRKVAVRGPRDFPVALAYLASHIMHHPLEGLQVSLGYCSFG